jgi:succinyl-CoA synthetase alpha subunit
MGHAGAIVSGGKGAYGTKRAALEKAGVKVADTPADVARFLGAK